MSISHIPGETKTLEPWSIKTIKTFPKTHLLIPSTHQVHLTPEQHGFELYGSNNAYIFFKKSTEKILGICNNLFEKFTDESFNLEISKKIKKMLGTS